MRGGDVVGGDNERSGGPLRAIERLEPALRAAHDRALARRAAAMRARARHDDPSLDDLLPESFALVREAARRKIGLRPFDVQIAGGLAMHRGKLVEMQTGEGKTLTAVAPAFLNALTGRGVHVLTFNDYLARRDAEWMGPVYELLGCSVGHVQEGMPGGERRRAYGRDVTYLTAKEAGFDLLRDGLCLERDEQVHRALHFALVDEADSILIDEARIPLVIAGNVEENNLGLPRIADIVRTFRRGEDFDTDEYAHNIFLSERGAEVVEKRLACKNLFASGNVNLLAAVRNALHAEHLLRRDVDYIVRGGAVELVDEFTGRVAEKRHWPDGLQAAVEAKEGLSPGSDGRILGSITLQHFLRLYPRLCGMTATAASARDELREMYGLEVEVVPPNRPCIREDRPDLIFTHREARDEALIHDVVTTHASGRPILVGTASVAESESLVAGRARTGITARVLNAKNDEQEAAIVAEAGAPGAVTISTNMAGRGTDIRLGGARELNRDRVVELGGLYVIGTHRHESVRIDRQLRGRAGRQGDPGSSQFYVSLDDDLLRRYGIERLIPRNALPGRVATPTDSRVVRREVERAQRIVEGECFDVRRRLYRYSEIIENQRKSILAWRQALLEDTAELDVLERRGGERWERIVFELGPARAREIERRLTLLVIDRCFSQYLGDMQSVRDEAHLVTLVGKEPLAEFFRTAIDSYPRLIARIDDEIVEKFATLEISPDGEVNWDAAGLRGPSATWTYLISDDLFGSNLFRGLANRPGIGLWAALLLGPVLFLWGLALHWRRWRDRKRGA
jgi:preprotein translocase subunit SecA